MCLRPLRRVSRLRFDVHATHRDGGLMRQVGFLHHRRNLFIGLGLNLIERRCRWLRNGNRGR